MKITNIFEKDIERQIEGVIKADDVDALQKEVEEYVVTDEVKKSLSLFFDAYNNSYGSNGVWISGFFGSGKSHLLKMLSCLLENAPMKDGTPLEFFIEKYDDNVMEREDLKKATSIPSKSILFNIDQKAPVGSKSETDAILAVFMKVFDEMCGYYGKQGYIAQFERDLDNKSIYNKFKSAYFEVSGKEWETGREQVILESKNIAAAYAEVTGEPVDSVKEVVNRYRSDYNLSIEDFAELINEYIKKQEKGFRLNFFVDEVGQYIADNIKLMTNLQTIAESLATKCNGQAWIIVTAQEEMNKIVGEMNNRQKNDFSKIQARFANRIKLTSKNVNEVIQKRLLLKNEEGKSLLSKIYDEQSNNFRTLFDFTDGSHVFPNFKNLNDFENCYPFIPYQFSLFQSSIEALSEHNAFEGRYSSVGERPMLSVFQQVAKMFNNTEVGGLATFDLMFEGIRGTLTSSVYRSISNVERGVGNELAIKLLKALFLVKYVKEFKSTLRNLCILLHGSFEVSLKDLREDVETALNFLEQQTYIQRNGEEYEYLTNEEKDVENEIKSIEIDQIALSDELRKLLFIDIIKSGNKIRYLVNKQDYLFSQKMDDKLYGKEYELAIHIASPLNSNIDRVDVLKNQSMGRDELLVIMPEDKRLMQDLLLSMQTAKYIKHASSHSQTKIVNRIIEEKRRQDDYRRKELEVYAGDLLKNSRLFINTAELTVSSSDSQSMIIDGFQQLIERVYTSLQVLPSVTYTENDIKSCLKSNASGDLLAGAGGLPPAEQEILNFTNMNKTSGVRTTIKSLCDRFESKPYGWYRWAVLCLLAQLCAKGKIEVRSDGNILELDELEPALKNSHGYANIMLDPQVEFSQSKVRALKDFYEDFFKKPAGTNDARSLAIETKQAFDCLWAEIEEMKAKYYNLPIVEEFEKVLGKLKEFRGKSYEWYLDELAKHEDVLFDLREKVVDPIEQFVNSQQVEIFSGISRYMKEHRDNFDSTDGEEVEFLSNFINDSQCYVGSKVRDAKEKFEQLQEKVNNRVYEEINVVNSHLSKLEGQVRSMPEYGELVESELREVGRHFEEFKESIGSSKLVAVIRDKARRFEDEVYPRILTALTSRQKNTGDEGEASGESSTPEYISVRVLDAGFIKPYLGSESDVDAYLSVLRRVIMDEIDNGKRVQV